MDELAKSLLDLCEYETRYLNATLMSQDIAKLLQTWLDGNINNIMQECDTYNKNKCVLHICRVLALIKHTPTFSGYLGGVLKYHKDVAKHINTHFANIIPKHIRDTYNKVLQEIFPKDISNIILSYSIKTEKFYSTLF